MIELDSDAYGDYEGPFRCWVCGGIQAIKTEDGLVHSVKEGPSCAGETDVAHCLSAGPPVKENSRSTVSTPRVAGKTVDRRLTR